METTNGGGFDTARLEGMAEDGLRQLLAATNAEINTEAEAAFKGLRTPAQVAELDQKLAFAEAIKAQIETFPQVPDLRERTSALKAFSTKRQTFMTPPSAGRSTGGAGDAGTNSNGATNGNTKSHFGIHVKGGDEPLGRGNLKSFGDLIVEEYARDTMAGTSWKAGRANQTWGCDLNHLLRLNGLGMSNDVDPGEFEAVKATLVTGSLERIADRPGVIEVATQQLTIANLLASGTIDAPVYRYMQESSYTNAATSVAEGTAKPEATLALAQATANVGKVAVWTKTSAEILEDFGSLRSFIDGRLRHMVSEEEERVLLYGTGTAPEISGITDHVIQTQAQSSGLTAATAIHKAITKVRVTGKAEPDGIVVHPTDYEILRLHPDSNAQFFGGGPFYSPYAGNGGYTTYLPLWGLRTVVTTAITAGTALVGKFMDAQLLRRSGVRVQMTNTDQDDFIKNLVTILAEARMALAVYRPLSFCSVTGLAAGTTV